MTVTMGAEPMVSPPICVECRHGHSFMNMPLWCGKLTVSEKKFDPVMGMCTETKTRYCLAERYDEHGECGWAGALFEPRPVIDIVAEARASTRWERFKEMFRS